jgi:hypothetical protein
MIEKIRKLIIIAMFSDDDLMTQLVLKGGNAIALVNNKFSRSSLDFDFSMENEFKDEDLSKIGKKIENALSTIFSINNITIFDFKFYKKPEIIKDEYKSFWGGYKAEFKLIDTNKYSPESMDKMRRESISVKKDYTAKRTFEIEISKFEFCTGKKNMDIDGYTIYVYTPEMIVIEKIRAICQQMKEYPLNVGKTARSRDFFDIHFLMKMFKINLLAEENIILIEQIFKAKKVPLKLIARIPDYKEFHQADFISVKSTIIRDVKEFEYYFNYVSGKTEPLKILWNK